MDRRRRNSFSKLDNEKRERSPAPAKFLNIEKLQLNHTIQNSPSPYMLNTTSPRDRNKKRATSPLPAPPKSLKFKRSVGSMDGDDEEGSSNSDLDIDKRLPMYKRVTSPTETFFSNVKHKANAPESRFSFGPSSTENSPRRQQAVSFPEPGNSSNEEDYGAVSGGLSDSSLDEEELGRQRKMSRRQSVDNTMD